MCEGGRDARPKADTCPDWIGKAYRPKCAYSHTGLRAWDSAIEAFTPRSEACKLHRSCQCEALLGRTEEKEKMANKSDITPDPDEHRSQRPTHRAGQAQLISRRHGHIYLLWVQQRPGVNRISYRAHSEQPRLDGGPGRRANARQRRGGWGLSSALGESCAPC